MALLVDPAGTLTETERAPGAENAAAEALGAFFGAPHLPSDPVLLAREVCAAAYAIQSAHVFKTSQK